MVPIDASCFRSGDAGGLSFAGVFEFHLGDAEEDAGDDPADRPIKVELLCDADDPYALLAPVGEEIDAFALLPREPVELPDDDRVDLAEEDRFP